MHGDLIPFFGGRSGGMKRFKPATKKHLRTCPHCGLPVDTRYWAEHRRRAHEAGRKEGRRD